MASDHREFWSKIATCDRIAYCNSAADARLLASASGKKTGWEAYGIRLRDRLYRSACRARRDCLASDLSAWMLNLEALKITASVIQTSPRVRQSRQVLMLLLHPAERDRIAR